MLVQPDKNELGDKRLDPKESVVKYREELLRDISHRKMYKQEEMTPERSSGSRLQYTELISRLRRVCPTIKAVDGSPGNIALYFPRSTKELEQATQEWQYDRDKFYLVNKYVAGFPKQEIPEFSHFLLDTDGIPTREYRGWRSILIVLLKQGVISYRGAVREFGEALGQRGWRWQMETQKWRHLPDTKFEASAAIQ
jgi:hypothetical protein